MKKRRFRQIRLATNAEIAAIASPALAERMFVDVDNDQFYYIDESGTARSIQGTGSGATNLAVANNTATTLDVTSDTGTDATIPAAVASTTAGLMTAADKTKLDGVATGATANSSDATLLDRANHTGTQAISTVKGLQIELDNKSDLSHTHTASDITDFDTEVSNNASVTANTAKVSADGSINTHSDVDTTGVSTGDLLQYDGTDWVPYTRPYISISNVTNTTTGISSSEADLVIDVVSKTTGTGDFTVASNEVTFIQAGEFECWFSASLNDASGGRGEAIVKLKRWDGSSWSNLTGTFSRVYLRGTSDGGTATGSRTFNFSANDKIKIVANRSNGSSTAVYQEQNSTTLVIKKV